MMQSWLLFYFISFLRLGFVPLEAKGGKGIILLSEVGGTPYAHSSGHGIS